MMELLQRPGELPAALDLQQLDPASLDTAEIAKKLSSPEALEFLRAQMAQGGFSPEDMLAMLIDYLTTKQSEQQQQQSRPRSFNMGGSTPNIRSVGNSWGGSGSGSGGGGGGGGTSGSSSSGSSSSGSSQPTIAKAQLPPGQGLDGLKVQVIGDSLMAGAQNQTKEALLGAGASSVDIDASVGRSITGSGEGNNMSPSEIRQQVERSGANVVVMELGTNHSDYARFIPETMNELSKIEPPPMVVWVNTQSQQSDHGSYGQEYFNQNAAINRVIEAEAKNRPNMVVADWSSIGGQSGINAGDGLHLTSSGSDAMADLILKAIADGRA